MSSLIVRLCIKKESRGYKMFAKTITIIINIRLLHSESNTVQ